MAYLASVSEPIHSVVFLIPRERLLALTRCWEWLYNLKVVIFMAQPAPWANTACIIEHARIQAQLIKNASFCKTIWAIWNVVVCSCSCKKIIRIAIAIPWDLYVLFSIVYFICKSQGFNATMAQEIKRTACKCKWTAWTKEVSWHLLIYVFII